MKQYLLLPLLGLAILTLPSACTPVQRGASVGGSIGAGTGKVIGKGGGAVVGAVGGTAKAVGSATKSAIQNNQARRGY